jgi:hypothetical protein
MAAALPCQRLPIGLIQAASSTEGRGSQTRDAPGAAASSTRVVTSNTRQPLAGVGLKALSAAKVARGAAKAAAVRAAVLMNCLRSMVFSGII